MEFRATKDKALAQPWTLTKPTADSVLLRQATLKSRVLNTTGSLETPRQSQLPRRLHQESVPDKALQEGIFLKTRLSTMTSLPPPPQNSCHS